MTVVHHATPGRRERVAAALLRGLTRALLKPGFSPRWPIAVQRRWLAAVSRLALPPRGIRLERAVVGGVAGEWVRSASMRDAAPRARVLYLHGGAYCVGTPATHRALTGWLAQVAGLPVFAADYRLAPEHPFPAGLDDAVAAARALAADGPLVIAGDSAGGGLALATALALRDAGAAADAEPQAGAARPAALVLLSPWVDLTLAHAPADDGIDPMLTRAWGEACTAHYLAGRDAAATPLASPLQADLRGLPPTLVQVGTDEMLRPEALRLHDALHAAGVAVRCEVNDGGWHVFQANAVALPSARAALVRIAGFVDAALAGASDAVHTHEVVVLGAGMSGLTMGVQLRRAGIDDFVIVEKSEGLGGTWWDNRYPGAHVDVPAPLYALSFAPNPDWSRRFASAPEIQAYMQRVAERHGVAAHLRFGTRIADARWIEARARWQITTESGERLYARHFVCSTGPLSQVRFPDIPGLADFRGMLLHSARWHPGIDLAGRRVAVIGTGSTASQLVAPIAAVAETLHVFQRTANWVMPRLDRVYGRLDRLLARFPPYAAAVRGFWQLLLEWGRRGFDEGTAARRTLLYAADAHLRAQVRDPELRLKLRPTYPFGCKRIIYSNDFYPALARPNVELVTDPITRITAHGIVTADGRERPLDALVCATGFDTAHLLATLEVTGRGGRTLREAWVGGPEAYRGITVAGFPNLWLLLGPNTGTGHTSTLLYIEPEVRYAIAAMRALRERGARSIEVREDVFRAHNDALQARLAGSVWTQCRSWYRMDGQGRVVALWPGFTREYVQGLRRPQWSEYIVA